MTCTHQRNGRCHSPDVMGMVFNRFRRPCPLVGLDGACFFHSEGYDDTKPNYMPPYTESGAAKLDAAGYWGKS